MHFNGILSFYALYITLLVDQTSQEGGNCRQLTVKETWILEKGQGKLYFLKLWHTTIARACFVILDSICCVFVVKVVEQMLLLNKDITEAIHILIETRKDVGVSTKNYLVLCSS